MTTPADKLAPRPWSKGDYWEDIIRDADGTTLLEIDRYDPSTINLSTDELALIVRAVNAHEALVQLV